MSCIGLPTCSLNTHLQEGRLIHQLPEPLGAPPRPQQAAADLVPTRHLGYGRIGFSNVKARERR